LPGLEINIALVLLDILLVIVSLAGRWNPSSAFVINETTLTPAASENPL
jgi:hypothetical protein